ncbi:MAG: IclR family transcriptional regulator [Planctomycetes bacterium]|nr:IclR family transcriptional regulator [Planctomycetota bacterium]
MATTQYNVQNVEKTIYLLEFLAEQDEPVGVTEISKGLGLNKNIVFRLLSTLEKHRWITPHEGPAYSLGLQPFRCFSHAFAKTSLRKAAIGPLEALWRESSDNTYLAVLDDTKTLFMESFESRRDVRCGGSAGGRFYSNCCAPGKVLLAFSSESVMEQLTKEGFTKMTESSITNPKKLNKELAQINKQGYGLDVEEYGRGMICFAAPIYDHNNKVIASIGVTSLLIYFTLNEFIMAIGPKVIKAAKEISIVLGASQEIQEGYDRTFTTISDSKNIHEKSS